MKKTILIFIGGYLPGKKYGGPVTSIENFTNQMCDTYNIRIVCNDHDFKDSTRYENISDGWNTVGNAQVYYTNERDYNYIAFRKLIEPFANDVELIYLSGIYYIKMNYAAIKVGRNFGIPVVLAPRGDLMKSTIAMKSNSKMLKKRVFLHIAKMFNIFSDVTFQATSDEEKLGLNHYLDVNDKRIFLLPNLPVMKHERASYVKQENEINILFLSRLMIKKNPYYALEIVREMSDKYKVSFDIYGPNEDQDYWSQCEVLIKKINNSKPNINITYRGSLNPEDAKLIYDKYDCFLFPTVSENYGHVIVESMFSNCPVVLSKGTTPWDDYGNKAGFVIPMDDRKQFTESLEHIAEMNNNDYQQLIKRNQEYVEKKFQVEKLKRQYTDLIEYLGKDIK